MIRLAIVGVGKMGLSHQAIANAHPKVELAGVCDSAGYLVDVLNRYTSVPVYTDYATMLDQASLDGVIVATPSASHAVMVRMALARGLHVFCEKPFTLHWEEGLELAAIAESAGLVSQVGYHARFIGPFQEAKRAIDSGTIGRVTHASAEAFGGVVLKTKGATWRSRRAEGGGCLYDYAAHPLNLLNWYFGAPLSTRGTVLGRIFSRETEDEVYGTLDFPNQVSARVAVNWSDASFRKMTIRLTVTGTQGRLEVDRQELQLFRRGAVPYNRRYGSGWTRSNATELTDTTWFYLRGEEYSAQIDHFVRRILDPRLPPVNDFVSAAETDRTIAMMIADAEGSPPASASLPPANFARAARAQPLRLRHRWHPRHWLPGRWLPARWRP
jgi:predicted dehydrogenase